MTDNSDFMSRYLPPENAGHREHAAPADERAEEVSLSDLRLPEPGAPQSPQMPPPAPLEFAPTCGLRWSTSRRRPLRLLRRRRAATLKALTLSPNRDRRLRQPPALVRPAAWAGGPAFVRSAAACRAAERGARVAGAGR